MFRGGEDQHVPHRVVPAHRLDLRGLRRPRARRTRRPGRVGRARGPRSSRSRCGTTQGPGPRGREGRDHRAGVVGDRFVQLTPVYEGGDEARRRRGARHRQDLDPAGARRDLLLDRRPDRRARPRGREQRRRTERAAHHHRRQLRRPGQAAQPDDQGPEHLHQHPRRQQGGALRLRRRARALRQRAGEERQGGPRLQPSISRCRRCWPGSARSWPRR